MSGINMQDGTSPMTNRILFDNKGGGPTASWLDEANAVNDKSTLRFPVNIWKVDGSGDSKPSRIMTNDGGGWMWKEHPRRRHETNNELWGY